MLCDKCGHKAYDHDERGDPMGCQVTGCPCREYSNYRLDKDDYLARPLNKVIDEFRAKHKDIPKTREQELEEEVSKLHKEVKMLKRQLFEARELYYEGKDEIL